MMKFFKRHFIPGPHNDHQPHILKKKGVFFILKFVLIVEVLFLIQILLIAPYTNIFSSILSNVLVDLTNIDRQNNNISILKTNLLLERAAKMKAEDMAQNNYFSHTSPSGKTPWEWLDEVGYKFKYAGENLAVNFIDSEDIERAWMDSPGHRSNILNTNFTEIGIGTAKGPYKGREAIFVVQFFAQPKVGGASASLMLENALLKSSFLQRALTAPKAIIKYVYLFIAFIVLLALFLKVFVKIKIQHPKLILNGIIALFVIVCILCLNIWLIGSGYVF